jgi:uncharacterized protein YraI
MNHAHLLLLGIGFGLVVPTASLAETAYTTKAVNLRAGPSREYPLVARVPEGMPVEVNGCVDDWTWCDVSLENGRGWVYAGNLDSPYQDHRVVILGNGPNFGFPIVTFSVGSYWDTYYRGRPWYSRRSYWVGRPAPNRWVGSRPSGVRAQVVRPSRPAVVVRPQVNRPQPERPRGGRLAAGQDPRGPEVARPQRQAARPQPQAARPQPQTARPAQAKPPDNRSRPQPQHREERKPGGN